ncbi:MAG: P1 family peptidase, partial [Thermomicrobiales bacterium]|nr:P1 family peptidase [Thermomicrobiales bacterium]
MADPAQVSIGHATDDVNQTGCTVILFDRAVPCVVDVRGGGPGTRETDLLAPGRL